MQSLSLVALTSSGQAGVPKNLSYPIQHVNKEQMEKFEEQLRTRSGIRLVQLDPTEVMHASEALPHVSGLHVLISIHMYMGYLMLDNSWLHTSKERHLPRLYPSIAH
jgi:hypothetical protein